MKPVRVTILLVGLLLLAAVPVLLMMPQAGAALPVSQERTWFFRDFDTYATGPVDPQDEHLELQQNSGHDADPDESFANITLVSGQNALDMSNLGVDAADGTMLQMNVSVPAVTPDYVVSMQVRKSSDYTTGWSGVRLVGNLTTTPYVQIRTNIAIFVMTGSNALGGCGATSACFYNTSSAAYEVADALSYDTWYTLTWEVQYNPSADASFVDAYLNGTLEQDDLPLFDTGDGERGFLHSITLDSDAGAGRQSRMLVDDVCVRGTLAAACGTLTYSIPQATVTPEGNRMDFVDTRYIQSLDDLMHTNYNDTQGWTVRQAQLLQPGPSGNQDDESAAQGVVFLENGVYYLYYSMRDGDYPIDAIGLATSTDGENFTKTTANGGGALTGVVMWNNPVAGRFDSWHTYDPAFVTWRTDRYWMIYAGTNVVDGGGARYLAGLAYSYNLTWWQRYPDNSTNSPLIDMAVGHDCRGDANFQSVVFDDGLYKGIVRCKVSEPSGIRTIHYASSPDLITWTLDDESDNTDGRRFVESNRHDASVWVHDGLWYMLVSRGMRTSAPQDNRWELALSSDGIHWQTAKWRYLNPPDMVPLGSSFDATNSALSLSHWAGIFYEGETMRMYVTGCTAAGCNAFEGAYFDLWERPINRWRGVTTLPGASSGILTTHPLGIIAGGITVNVENNATSNVTVEILDAAGGIIYSVSDPVTTSGASVVVTWDGTSIISLPSTIKVRIRFTAGAQLFDIGFTAGSFQSEAVTWLLEYGSAWTTLLVGAGIIILILSSFWVGIKKRKGQRQKGKIWKYMPRKFR